MVKFCTTSQILSAKPTENSLARLSWILLVALLLHTPGIAAAQTGRSDLGEVYVAVKSARLRAEPLAWAPAKVEVQFGDKLQTVSESGAWLRVRAASGEEGFLHRTAISPRTIVLRGSTTQDSIVGSTNEIVLAGKGFNSDVEALFAKERRSARYDLVEQIERTMVSADRLERFVSAGHLFPETKEAQTGETL